ncbi:MAG: metallophosphoesterase [Firmicutes bacterium]|nr:metallophosphoesterase [Bacillota bacterium]
MKPLQFYLITDLHYFENSLGAEGEAYEARSLTDQKCIAETGAIIDSAFARLAEDKETEIILIAGDMTFNGEVESHKVMLQKLEALTAAGKKIYMVSGNHDGDNEAYAFSGANRIDVEAATREALPDLYYEYGWKDAIAVEGNRRCYVSQLGEGVRMLGIYHNLDDGNRGFGELMPWITEQIEDAKRSGDLLFGMTHVPILPGAPILAPVGDATIHGRKDVARRLAEAGLPLMFTGHMHMQSLNKFCTRRGSFLFDICTGSLVGGPCAIRKISIDENRVMRITSETVADFDWDKRGMTAEEYFVWRFNRKIDNAILSKIGNESIAGFIRRRRLFQYGINRVRKIFYGNALDSGAVIDLRGGSVSPLLK